ncbi:MAG: HlyC/CorC family transporter [Deltaproteobacteria bacterium]|nr:HlyC/CorC family transporter [Deltaproteobacteria bacterium]
MSASLFSYFILLAVLLGLSAFFAGAETVFFSLNRSQLDQFRESKSPLAKPLLNFLSRPKDILVTILFGNELTNIAISITIASLFYQILPSAPIEQLTLISVGVGTFLILVVGEIIPKSVGIVHAPALAPLTAFLLKPLHALLKPVRPLLVRLADWFIKKLGGTVPQQTSLILEEEFRDLLELSAKTGEVEAEEKEMIAKALDFRNKIVSQIMTPMRQVFKLAVDIPYPELLEQIKATRFSRILVYENDPKNIVGLLYVKDLFLFDRRWKQNNALTIQTILRKPLFVSKQEHLEDLLQKIRETRIHMAVVTDAQNKPVGIATLHDVLEELFGEVAG